MRQYDLTTLSQADIDQNIALLTQMLNDNNSTLDVSRGSVLYNLLLVPAAMFHTLNDTEITAYQRSASLQAINEDPGLADDDMVDQLLSNYGVVRAAGTNATGSIVIVKTTNATTPIIAGTQFLSNGLVFQTVDPFVGVPSAGMVNNPETDRLITQRSDGTYAFTITVQAVDAGSEYQLSKGTALTMATAFSGFIRAYAEYDFAGGTSTESNAALIGRLHLGVADKSLVSQPSTEALLREQLPEITAVSMIGMGAAEMSRDSHNQFSIKTGGRSDIYVQTADRPRVVRRTMEAVLVSPADSLWQISFSREESAGVYYIDAITPSTVTSYDGSLHITQIIRTVATGDYPVPHEIESIEEAGASYFQKITVEFKDTTINTSSYTAGTVGDYYVDVMVMPNIQLLQEFVDDDTSRNYRYDDLILPPVPCFLTVTIGIKVLTSASNINIATLKQAVADRVNALGFSDRIYPSVILDTAANYLGSNGYVLSSPDITGRLYRRDGVNSTLYRSSTLLRITEDVYNGITHNTVKFFISPDSIDVELL